MKLTLQNISLAFAAGCLGGLATCLLFGFDVIGLTVGPGSATRPGLFSTLALSESGLGRPLGLVCFSYLPKISFPCEPCSLAWGHPAWPPSLVLPFQAHKGVLGLNSAL